jgi:hypothetical protein
VRVPLPLAILLLLAVPLGTWFARTRKMDFLTPPSAETLEITRQRGLTMLPRMAVQLPAPPPALRPIDSRPPRSIQTRPPSPSAVENRNPALDTFCSSAAKGSRHLIELSTLLQSMGDNRHALLAWERVIDSTKPEKTHMTAALVMVERLRKVLPPWSASNRPVPVVIHLSCTHTVEDRLRPLAEPLAKDLIQASHGVLAATTELTVLPPPGSYKSKSGRTIRKKSPTPAISVWLSGPGAETRSTPMVSFNPTSIRNLHDQLQRTLFRIAGKSIAAEKGKVELTTPPNDEPPLDSLSHRVTRLRWLQLGRAINEPKPPPEPDPPPKPASPRK